MANGVNYSPIRKSTGFYRLEISIALPVWSLDLFAQLILPGIPPSKSQRNDFLTPCTVIQTKCYKYRSCLALQRSAMSVAKEMLITSAPEEWHVNIYDGR